MYLIFDTETTGLPKKFNAPVTDLTIGQGVSNCLAASWLTDSNRAQ